jgi:hypothetical protein
VVAERRYDPEVRVADGQEAMRNRTPEEDERVARCKADGYRASGRLRTNRGERLPGPPGVEDEDAPVPRSDVRTGIVDAGDDGEVALVDISMQTQMVACSPVVRIRSLRP